MTGMIWDAENGRKRDAVIFLRRRRMSWIHWRNLDRFTASRNIREPVRA